MSNNNKSSGGGIGATSALTMIFIVLKLVGVINWSWWWVLSPLWIGLALGLMLLGIAVVCAVIKVKMDEKDGAE